MKIKQPRRVKHSYTQSLSASPEKVFPLLCPVREIEWVPDWNPELVISSSGVAEEGCVFVTPGTPENAIWVITHYDPETYSIEMVKITPNHTVGKLEISLSDDGAGGTRAKVAYEFTALNSEGEAFLDEFTEEWYQDFMKNWERALNHYLSTGQKVA